MKKKKYLLLLVLVYVVFELNSQKNYFPETDQILGAKSGELILNEGYFKNKKYKSYDKKLKADFGTLIVPENRKKPNSKLINLPVIRIKSLSNTPKEPVFLLRGGPGLSNIWNGPLLWLLDNHDIVMVGYRGVDGSISLNSPEFSEALMVDNPLSYDNLKKIGEAAGVSYKRLVDEGIDVSAYNMIEVIDDMEATRKALGYNKVNLLGRSYGTRLAYLYGLRYPESINRSFLEAVNPPGHFIWEPDKIDNQLHYLNSLWQKNEDCKKQSPDMVKTIKNVLSTLPLKWKKIRVDPDKVKIMTFNLLYSREGISQVFQAYLAAENGDYSGIAFMNVMYDMLPKMGLNWGDSFCKAMSADYDFSRDYETEMDAENYIIGSPMSKLIGFMKYGTWPINSIPSEYKETQKSEVETLMLSGDIDFSTPADYAKELLTYLPKGHHVILKGRGHQDTGKFQNDEYHKLVKTFFLTGEVDDSGFVEKPLDFKPNMSLQKMGKMYISLKRLGLAKLVMAIMT